MEILIRSMYISKYLQNYLGSYNKKNIFTTYKLTTLPKRSSSNTACSLHYYYHCYDYDYCVVFFDALCQYA